jgi:hypothetical protein
MGVANTCYRGIAGGGVILALSLGGPAARAQSLSTDDASSASPAPARLSASPTFSVKRSRGLQGRRAPDDRQRRSSYFDRWDIELSIGAEALEGLPDAISTEGFFLSAGLYLGGSLAVIAETGTTGRAAGRLTTPGRAPQKFVDTSRYWPSKPAACPRIDAGFGTYLAGVQYRRRFRRTAVLVRGLAGRAEYSGTATEIGEGGVHTSCYDAFGSGRALAAGGGIDVHLNDRIAIRVLADYRRLAVPSLEGMESVFMAPADGARLDMVRVAVGLVIGI